MLCSMLCSAAAAILLPASQHGMCINAAQQQGNVVSVGVPAWEAAALSSFSAGLLPLSFLAALQVPDCLCLSLVPGVAIVLHVTTCIIYAHLDYRPDGIWLCCCR
jgi:hypothetical protein